MDFEEAYEAHIDSLEPGNLYASDLPDYPTYVHAGPGDHAPNEEPTDFYVDHPQLGQQWFASGQEALDYCTAHKLTPLWG